MRIIPFVLFALSLTGCAIGQRINYADGFGFVPKVPSGSTIGVAVQDIRPSVLSEENSESNVGILRSLAGVPWAVKTASGRPLAFDLGVSITQTFSKNGYKAIHVTSVLNESQDVILERARSLLGSADGLLITFFLREWATDTWGTTTFNYCVELLVKRMSGVQLGTSTKCGSTKIEAEREGFNDFTTAVATVLGEVVNSNFEKIDLGGQSHRPN